MYVKKKFGKNIQLTKMLNYGKKQSESSIGLRLLKIAEKDIVCKSQMFEIDGLSPDDIAQLLREKIWSVRNKYNPKKSSIKTFTSFVIRNYLKDLYKKSKNKKEILNRSISLEKFKEKF